MFRKILRKWLKNEEGMILPLALVLLVAAALIVTPGLWAAGNMITVNRNMQGDTLAYYAASGGITDALWHFKNNSNIPKSTGIWYTLPSTVNGMSVTLSLLNYNTSTGMYYIQSQASSGSTMKATVVAGIQQTNTSNNIFNQAAAALNGNICMSGGNKIISDNMSTGSTNYGNIYANGNISIQPSAIVGGNSCPAKGIASATGTVTVNTIGGACVGSSVSGATPVSFSVNVQNFINQANAGQHYSSNPVPSYGTYYLGPAYINGNVTIGGSVHVILQGTVYVNGTLTITGSAYVEGPYTIVSSGAVTISGGSSANLVAGDIPFIITQSNYTCNNSCSSCTSCSNWAVSITGSAAVAAVIYAPNGCVTIQGGTGSNGYNVYGSVIAQSVCMSGSTVIKFLTGIKSETQIPGANQQGGTTTTLMGYDWH